MRGRMRLILRCSAPRSVFSALKKVKMEPGGALEDRNGIQRPDEGKGRANFKTPHIFPKKEIDGEAGGGLLR